MDTETNARAKRSGGRAAALVLLAVAATPAAAADYPRATAETGTSKPLMGRGLTPEVTRKLLVGFDVAISRSRELPQCGAMFRDLGADPSDLLGRSYYVPAELNWGQRACPDGVLASTLVGSPLTRVCKDFGQLGKKGAALVLLHEALHFAGLQEQPQDPAAMTAREINDMVRVRCGL